MSHTKRENDVLDECPLGLLGVRCPAPLMSLSVSDPEVTVSFYTDKNLLQNQSLSTGAKATGEDSLFSNCFPLAAEMGCLWVNPVHVMALIGERVIQAHQLCMCRMASLVVPSGFVQAAATFWTNCTAGHPTTPNSPQSFLPTVPPWCKEVFLVSFLRSFFKG